MAVFVAVDSVVVGAAGCVANCYYSDGLAWTTDRYVESVVWLMRLVYIIVVYISVYNNLNTCLKLFARPDSAQSHLPRIIARSREQIFGFVQCSLVCI